MPDREKVIGHLNDCMEASRRDNTWVFVRKDIVEDALALLKEQEAVKPKKADNPEESEYCCGICGYPLWLDELYCAHCGRRVLWEGR